MGDASLDRVIQLLEQISASVGATPVKQVQRDRKPAKEVQRERKNLSSISDQTRDDLKTAGEVASDVLEIVSDVIVDNRPLSSACKSRGYNYILFRRWCSKFVQLKEGGYQRDVIIPEYSPSLEEIIYAKIFGVPAEEAAAIMPPDAEETVEHYLQKLPDREREILISRANGETFEAISGKYGVTRERIRQIEVKAIRTIRFDSRLFVLGKETLEKERLFNEERNTFFKLIEIAQNHLMKAEEATQNESSDAATKAINDVYMDAIKVLRDTHIEDLNLSVRSFNCLKRANLNTMADVYAAGRNKLSRIRNLGKYCLMEIDAVFASRGFKIPEGEYIAVEQGEINDDSE